MVNDYNYNNNNYYYTQVSVVGAAQQQIMIGHMQKELQASANQLLVAYTPYVAPMLAMLAPLELLLPANYAVEGSTFAAYNEWYANHCSYRAVSTIALSAFLGLLVSLSTFLVIGATSALTYNIVGHAKTVVILLVGVFYFGDSWGVVKAFGILFALAGVAWYSHIKRMATAGGSGGGGGKKPSSPEPSPRIPSGVLSNRSSAREGGLAPAFAAGGSTFLV